ncbi:MAG: type II toxin-antitoxin system RelE/ParE family toxin [Deltaproteobacteria bacterium]|nr:type II toxin-antitoxin system RelE/ParE family toxin [Deltaproteobacteria bacterium]
MVAYQLQFLKSAEKEWRKLAPDLKTQFRRKLAERLQNPRVPSAALCGMPDCYKIKLQDAGYRLVYRVENNIVFVTVIAIGKRDKNKVYEAAQGRL